MLASIARLAHSDRLGGPVRRRRWSIEYAALSLCAACAGPSANFPALPADDVAAERLRQEIAQMRDYYAQLHRLDTVAFRIRTANRADCKESVSGHIGLLAVTPQSLPRKSLLLGGSTRTALGAGDGHIGCRGFAGRRRRHRQRRRADDVQQRACAGDRHVRLDGPIPARQWRTSGASYFQTRR